MFIKEVTLKRNGVSSRLIRYVLPGIKPFNNFCSHFWLTIFAGIFFIPTVIARSLITVMEKIALIRNKWLDNYAEKQLKLLSNEDAAKWYYWNDASYTEHPLPLSRCELKRFKRIKQLRLRFLSSANDPRYDIIREKASQGNGAWCDTWVDKIRKQTTNPAILARAILLGKILTIVILLPSAVLGIYWSCMFIGSVFYWVYYHWLAVLFTFGIMIVTILIVLLLAGLLNLFILIPEIPWLCILGEKINNYIRICVAGITTFFSFFWTMIKTWKSNNCPGIIWKD